MPMTMARGHNTRESKFTDFSDVDFKNNNSIVDFVQYETTNRYDKEVFERQWYIDVAQYLGRQYMQWSPLRKQMFLPPAPKHRVRLVFNRLLPAVRRVIASTMRRRPQWTVQAATSEVEDRAVAQISTQVARHLWSKESMNEKLVRLLTWRSVTGNAFARVYWNPYRGDRVGVDFADLSGRAPRDSKDEKEVAELREQGKKFALGEKLVSTEDAKGDTTEVALGDVSIEVLSPFQVDPDRYASSWPDVRYAIMTHMRSAKYLMDHYGLKKSQIGPSDDSAKLSDTWEGQVKSLGTPSSYGETQDTPKDDQHKVSVIYVKPCKGQPNGWWAVVYNDHVLRKAENEEGFPTFPLVMIKEIDVPGRLWGTSVMEQSIPMQAAYNRARSQEIEYCNTICMPPWMIPRGSGLKRGDITGEPSANIMFNPPYMPTMQQPPPLPSTMPQHVQQTITDIQDVTNQHEATQGQAPGRVDSASAISNLQEADDSVLQPTNMVSSDALGDLGAMAMQIVAKMWDEERLVKVVGEDKVPETNYVKGKDLVGKNSERAGVNYFDVEFELQSSLPHSKPARQNLARMLAELGIMNPQSPMDRDKLLEIMEVGGSPGEVSKTNTQRQNARREIDEMMAGGVPEIWPWDDHQVHIDETRVFQATPAYWEKIQSEGGKESPVHQVFEAHLEAHTMQLQAEVQEFSQLSGGGQPPEPGPPQSQPIPGGV